MMEVFSPVSRQPSAACSPTVSMAAASVPWPDSVEAEGDDGRAGGDSRKPAVELGRGSVRGQHAADQRRVEHGVADRQVGRREFFQHDAGADRVEALAAELLGDPDREQALGRQLFEQGRTVFGPPVALGPEGRDAVGGELADPFGQRLLLGGEVGVHRSPSRRANFWIFPDGVRGSAPTISSRSGQYCLAIPSPARWTRRSSRLSSEEATITAQARSPSRGSG